MELVTIYHNPRCSKSRQALALLEESAQNFTVIEYLKEPIDNDVLLRAYQVLGIKLLRVKEQDFKNLDLNLDSVNEKVFIELINKYPKLLERPLIVKNKQFVIARPPEKVLNLL